MDVKEVMEHLLQADMVLVGLGEEFDDIKRLRSDEAYQYGRQQLQEAGCEWLLPAWNEYCSGKLEDIVTPVLEKLRRLLENKNYFVVSVSTNSAIERVLTEEERLVMPCGSMLMKQCAGACKGELVPLTEPDRLAIQCFFDDIYVGRFAQHGIPELGKCLCCGRTRILNNIYAQCYDEEGYQGKWQLYTRWLQGTLNRRLLLLELGVGLQFPSVVRWPFEKIAMYNEKAFLCRVHEKLYQLPEEVAEKGSGISENAIDWLGQL